MLQNFPHQIQTQETWTSLVPNSSNFLHYFKVPMYEIVQYKVYSTYYELYLYRYIMYEYILWYLHYESEVLPA